MKRSIIILSLVAPLFAQAMPEGSFDCETASKTAVSLNISNYGEPTILAISSLALEGKDIDVTKEILVYRQWVNDKAANIELSLPAEKYFTKSLKIEVKSNDGTSYSGTAKIQIQDGDYSDPVKTIKSEAVTCEYFP